MLDTEVVSGKRIALVSSFADVTYCFDIDSVLRTERGNRFNDAYYSECINLPMIYFLEKGRLTPQSLSPSPFPSHFFRFVSLHLSLPIFILFDTLSIPLPLTSALSLHLTVPETHTQTHCCTMGAHNDGSHGSLLCPSSLPPSSLPSVLADACCGPGPR